MKRKKPNGPNPKRGFMQRAVLLLLCFAMLIGSLPQNAFAAGSGQGETLQSNTRNLASGKSVKNTYVLEVSSGINDGMHVEYFCISYKTYGKLHREYVFPHGELNTGYNGSGSTAGKIQMSFCNSLSADSKARTEYAESNMLEIGSHDFKTNPGGGLGASRTETFLFSLPFTLTELVDISFYIASDAVHASSGSKSDWLCQGLRLYRADTLYGREMAGYYSSESYWAFDGELIAQLKFGNNAAGYQFRTNNGGNVISLKSDPYGEYYLDTTLSGVNKQHKNADSNPSLLIRLDLADVADGGIEALATQFIYEADEGVPKNEQLLRFNNIQDLKLMESMALDVYYLDEFGNERKVSMPVISSFVGWLAQHYPSLTKGDPYLLAGIAQQGDTLIFDAILPGFKEVTAFTISVGSKAVYQSGMDLVWREQVNPYYDELIGMPRADMLETEKASILAVSVYDPSKADYSAAMDGSSIYCHVNGIPLSAYTAGSYVGVPVGNTPVKLSAKAVQADGDSSRTGMLVLPSPGSENYVVELCTDAVEGSSTTDSLYLSLRYVDKNGKEHTTDAQLVEDAVKAEMGYWPYIDFSGVRAPMAYKRGMQLGNRLQFLIIAPQVDYFSGAELEIRSRDGNSQTVIDDWQMSFLNIYSAAARGRRHIEMHSELKILGQIYTQQTITRSLDTSKRIVAYNQKVLLDSSQPKVSITFDNTGRGGSSSSDTEPYDWNTISQKMSYNETKIDFGFASSRITYKVNVNVSSNVGELASSSEYGDCGSVNQYYFQLVFENGKSAYVLANQQLTADGFRAGETETFLVDTNRNYGSLVAIHILPDDTIEEENIYDKLRISSISVEEMSSRAVNRTWLFDDLGWVDINFSDSGAQGTVQGQKARMESEMVSAYLTEKESYSINLMIAVTTGMFDKNMRYDGSLSCYLNYEKIDGTMGRSGTVDVSALMAAYAGKTPDSQDLVDGFQRIDNEYMLQSNHTSRFFFSVENVRSLLSITFILHGDSYFEWPIKEVDVYQVVESGTLFRNNCGEYQRSGKVEFLCRSGSTSEQTVSVTKNMTKPVTVNFTENGITMDPTSLELSIKRVPDAGTDTLNILLYPADSAKTDAAIGASVDLNYRRWDDQYETKNFSGFIKGESGAYVYLYDVEATGMTALEQLTLKEPEGVPMDHVVVQHSRNGVIVDTYYFDLKDVPAGTAVEPEKGSSTKKQELLLRMDENTIRSTLTAGENDIAVALLYLSENSINGEAYQSETVFLTDFGYTEVDPGDLYRVSFNRDEVTQVIGLVVAKLGGLYAEINGAVLTEYKLNETDDSWIFADEYYFDQRVELLHEKQTISGTEDPLTLVTVDMEVSSDVLETYEVDQLELEIAITDTDGDRSVILEDINDYLTGPSLTQGGNGQVNVLIPNLNSIRYVRLIPRNADPDVVAQWGLKKTEISKTLKGVTTRLVTDMCTEPVFQDTGYSINLKPVTMSVEVKPQAVKETTSFNAFTLTTGMNESSKKVDLDFREKLAFDINIQNGLPESGYTISVEKLDAVSGQWSAVEKPESYVLKTAKDSYLFNPPVVYGVVNYRLTITAAERADQPLTIEVSCTETEEVRYYLCELDFAETTPETVLNASDLDVYAAFTYLPKEGDPESELRMSPYYRLSSLLGNIKGGMSFVLPEAVGAGGFLKSAVVMAYIPAEEEENPEENPGAEDEPEADHPVLPEEEPEPVMTEIDLSRIRLCEVDENYGYVMDVPFLVSDQPTEQPLKKETLQLSDTRELSAANYVRNGLVAQFDGIENYAYGKHSADVPSWNDLTGKYSAELINYVKGSWDMNRLILNREMYGLFDAELPANGTIEIVCDAPITAGSAQYQALLMATDHSTAIYRSGNSLYFRHNDNSMTSCPSITDYNGSSVVATYAGRNAALGYAGLLNMRETESDKAGNPMDKTWTIGSVDSSYALEGRIYAIRIYNRALSEEELVQNYLYDQMRFFGKSLEDALFELNAAYLEQQDTEQSYYYWRVSGRAETGLTAIKQQMTIVELSGQTEYTVQEEENTPPFMLDVKASEADVLLTYTSSDKAVVTVSSEGEVTVVGPGTAEITVKTAGSEYVREAEMKITVTVLPLYHDNVLTPEETEYYRNVGDPDFEVKVMAEVPTTFTYSSSNPAVAAVDSKGMVTPIAEGTAIITVKAAAVGYTNAAETTVKVKVSPFMMDYELSGTASYERNLKDGAFTLDVVSTQKDTVLSYRSSDKSVLTVDGDGYVTVIGPGKATITVTGDLDGSVETFTVTVTVYRDNAVSGEQYYFFNDVEVAELHKKTFMLDAKAEVEGTVLTYSSADKSVVTVDSEGEVTIHGEGKTTITVKANARDYIKEATMEVTVTVTVNKLENAIHYDGAADPSVAAGDTLPLSARADYGDTIQYKSSDEKVAKVDESGKLTGIAAGTAVITFTVAEGPTYKAAELKLTVTVTKAPNAVYNDGEAAPVVVIGTPLPLSIRADHGTVQYESSDPGVATVDASGVVTGITAGTAEISYTVEASDSYEGASGKLTVTVTAPPTP